MHTSGVSSFGFSGTIAHALLQKAAVQEKLALGEPRVLVYRRRSFAWREVAADTSGMQRVSMYSCCWCRISAQPTEAKASSYLLISSHTPTASVHSATSEQACTAVMLLLTGASSGAPMVLGTHLALALAPAGG